MTPTDKVPQNKNFSKITELAEKEITNYNINIQEITDFNIDNLTRIINNLHHLYPLIVNFFLVIRVDFIEFAKIWLEARYHSPTISKDIIIDLNFPTKYATTEKLVQEIIKTNIKRESIERDLKYPLSNN